MIFLIYFPLILTTALSGVWFVGFIFSIINFFLVSFTNISVMHYVHKKELENKKLSIAELVAFITKNLLKFVKIAAIHFVLMMASTILIFVVLGVLILGAWYLSAHQTFTGIIVFAICFASFLAIIFISGRFVVNLAFVFQVAATEDFDTAYEYFIYSKKIARSHPDKADYYMLFGVLLLLPLIFIAMIVLFPFVKALSLLALIGFGMPVLSILNILFGSVVLIFFLFLSQEIKNFPKYPEVLEKDFKTVF